MAKLLDFLGNLVNAKQVTAAPQTASAVQLYREFHNHPANGLTPSKLKALLAQAELGNLQAQAELFSDMEERDCHIQAELHKRKMAVTGLDWNLQPLDDASATERKACKALEARLRDMLDMESLLFDMLDGVGYGYSALELEWKLDNIGWFPRLHHRPASWFTVAPEQQNTLRLRDNSSLVGVELLPMGWLVHQHKSRTGYLARSGLHRALAWPYLYKNYAVADLAEFLEIYGIPIRLGTYFRGATEGEKKTLMQAVMSIGHNAGGIIPEGMSIDFANAMASGNADGYKAMIDFCEASQSKAILGGTLTSQTGANGNRSLGDVHNEVRLDIRNSDARQLARTLSNQLIYPIAQLNGLFADDSRVPRFVFDTQEPDDLALFADAIPKLVNAGLSIPARYAYDKLKIPMPESDEAVLGVAGVRASPQPTAALSDSRGGFIHSEPKFTDKQMAIESLADALLANVASPIEPAKIQAAILAATDPADLEARLALLLDSSNTLQFSAALEKALFAADIMGYAHAN